MIVNDEPRRVAAGVVALAFGGAFIATGLFVAIGSADKHYNYSTDEILMLANAAEQAGQYETAIERLEELNRRLAGVEASDRLRKRIQKIKNLQADDLPRSKQ